VEDLRFEPGTTVAAPAPIVATLGTAGAPVAQRTTAVEAGSLGSTGLTAPAGSLVRAFAPYTAPAAGTTGTLTVPAGGTGRPLPLRLTVAANGPEGTAARDNAQITSTLSWGTQSMSVQTVLLPAGAVVLLDVATPAGGGIALWAPSATGGTASPLGMFDDGWSGTGRATYTTPRAGRYAFGPLSFDATGNGTYKLTASWTPRSTLHRPQFPTFNPLKDGYRDTDELTFKPDRRLTKAQVDVFDSKGRRVWIGYTGAVAAGATGRVRFGGYTGAGTRRPAGRYTYSITMTTPSGLRGTTNRTAFNLSWARR